MVTYDIIPRKEGFYASFPSLLSYKQHVYLFYRHGETSSDHPHGRHGIVRVFRVPTDALLSQSIEAVHYESTDEIVFGASEDNEIDAVASCLGDRMYCLGTRHFIRGFKNDVFVSFAEQPVFRDRQKLALKHVHLSALYGRAFSCPQGYVLPAYGALKGETFTRPLLLVTDDGDHWDVLSYLPSGFGENVILNESSIVGDNGQYTIFMRQDTPPFGIWLARSPDLQHWSEPKQMIERAHAPHAFRFGGQTLLAYRQLLAPKSASIQLCAVGSEENSQTIDRYEGNPYDGGYSWMECIRDQLAIAYYLGNSAGEPSIKLSMVNTEQLGLKPSMPEGSPNKDIILL